MKLDSWHKHDEDFSSFLSVSCGVLLAKLPVDADRRSGVKYPFVKVRQNAVLFKNSCSDITLEAFKLHWSL